MMSLRSLHFISLWLLTTKLSLATDYVFGTGDHVCATNSLCADSLIDIESGSDFSLHCEDANSCDNSTIVVHSGCTLRDPGIDCNSRQEACINAEIAVNSSDLTTNAGVYLNCQSGAYARLCKDMQLTLMDSHLKLICGSSDCRYLEAHLFGSSTLELVVDSVFSDGAIYLFDNSVLIDNGITDGYELFDERPTSTTLIPATSVAFISSTTLPPITSTIAIPTTTDLPTTTTKSTTTTTNEPSTTTTVTPITTTTTIPTTTISNTHPITTTTAIPSTTTTPESTSATSSSAKPTNSSSATPSFWSSSSPPDDKSKSGLPFPLMYGAIGAGIVVLAITCCCCFFFCKRGSKQYEEEEEDESSLFDKSSKMPFDSVDTDTAAAKNTVEEEGETAAFIEDEEKQMYYSTPGGPYIDSDIDLQESSSE